MKPIRISGGLTFSRLGWVVFGAAWAWLFLSWGLAEGLVRTTIDSPSGGPPAPLAAGVVGSAVTLDLGEFRRSRRRLLHRQLLQVLVVGLLGLVFYLVVMVRH